MANPGLFPNPYGLFLPIPKKEVSGRGIATDIASVTPSLIV